MMEIIRTQYDKLYDVFEEKKNVYSNERAVILRAMDILWIDHLAAMTALRTGIGLQGYGHDPLVEYKKKATTCSNTFWLRSTTKLHTLKYASTPDMKVQAELGRSVFQKAG